MAYCGVLYAAIDKTGPVGDKQAAGWVDNFLLSHPKVKVWSLQEVYAAGTLASSEKASGSFENTELR